MWNFQFMDNLGGKEWPGLAEDAANWSRWVLWVLFVMNVSEYTQSNLLSRPRLAARRMKKWNSSEQSIHVLMSALNDFVFKNCLRKKTSWIIVYDLTIHMMKVWTIQTNILIKTFKRKESFNCQNEVCGELFYSTHLNLDNFRPATQFFISLHSPRQPFFAELHFLIWLNLYLNEIKCRHFGLN